MKSPTAKRALEFARNSIFDVIMGIVPATAPEYRAVLDAYQQVSNLWWKETPARDAIEVPRRDVIEVYGGWVEFYGPGNNIIHRIRQQSVEIIED